MMDQMTFKLHHPLTEEEMDAITDADLENTPKITFHTKHGKEVTYKKHITGKWHEVVVNGRMVFICNQCGYQQQHETNYCSYCGMEAET